MKKIESEQKNELARLYYMQGETQKVIAGKVGVSETTIVKWCEHGDWQKKRAGLTITRPEIVNRNLMLISKLLDELNNSDNLLKDAGSVADKICKLAAAIERIDKKASVIDAIEVFMAFNKWIEYRMSYDKEITPELIRAINHYQDLYISEHIKK